MCCVSVNSGDERSKESPFGDWSGAVRWCTQKKTQMNEVLSQMSVQSGKSNPEFLRVRIKKDRNETVGYFIIIQKRS